VVEEPVVAQPVFAQPVFAQPVVSRKTRRNLEPRQNVTRPTYASTLKRTNKYEAPKFRNRFGPTYNGRKY
jgi:hypothetical protein